MAAKLQNTRPTIYDVARDAKVAHMTVSRVFSNSKKVSEDTRKRVMSVADRLGYRPSHAARTFVSGQTRCIGLIFPPEGPFVQGPYGRLINALARRLQSHHYSLMLISTADPSWHDHLTGKKVDGCFIFHPVPEGLGDLLDRFDLPGLALNHVCDLKVSHLRVDDRMGGRLVGEHLVGLGHRRVLYVSSHYRKHYSVADRRDGMRAVLHSMGGDLIEAYLDEADQDPSEHHAERLLIDHPDVTALVSYDDMTAYRLLIASHRLGRDVPGDLSIVGFNDDRLSACVYPPLTTVALPMKELADRAIDHILNRLESRTQAPADSAEDLLFTPELIVRESTGPARA